MQVNFFPPTGSCLLRHQSLSQEGSYKACLLLQNQYLKRFYNLSRLCRVLQKAARFLRTSVTSVTCSPSNPTSPSHTLSLFLDFNFNPNQRSLPATSYTPGVESFAGSSYTSFATASFPRIQPVWTTHLSPLAYAWGL